MGEVTLILYSGRQPEITAGTTHKRNSPKQAFIRLTFLASGGEVRPFLEAKGETPICLFRRDLMKAIRNRKNIGIKRCIFATTIAAALMVPAQAIAISCGASAAGSVLTSDPIFLGQEVTLRASIGASVIDGGTEITIPEWSVFNICTDSTPRRDMG